MRICKVEGCENKYKAKGYCSKHYKILYRNDDPLHLGIKKRMKTCKIDGCENEHRAKGYCKSHYDKWKKYNDPFHIKKQKSHGMRNTSEYKTWQSMKTRCYNPNDKYYHRYGGRGITVCDRWRNSFTAFFRDMGLKPFKGAQIDRTDNDGNYELENCQWVSNKDNARNTSKTVLTMKKAKEIRRKHNKGGVSGPLLAKQYNVSNSVIHAVLINRTWIR